MNYRPPMFNGMPPPNPMNAMPPPPLSGPNPFMPPNPMMLGGPNPMMNPQITVGMGPNAMPPSPPPPNQIPLPPPNPNTFKIQPQTQQGGGSRQNQENEGNRDNKAQGKPSGMPPFAMPFNNLNFPAPHAAPPPLDGSRPNSGGGTGSSTPNRVSLAPMGGMATFVPTMNPMNVNPMMMNPMMPLPSQLSPVLGPTGKGTSTSNSPHLTALSHSPPNMFIPPFAGGKPPPPQNFVIPSPNLNNNLLPNMNMAQFPRPTTSPSPPVSPLLNPHMNPVLPPFIPSPQLMQPHTGQMPPIQLNHPMNPMLLPNQFANLQLNAAPKVTSTPMMNNTRKSVTGIPSKPTLSSSRKSVTGTAPQ